MKRILLLLGICILLAGRVLAQADEYSFPDPEHNELKFQGDKRIFARFFLKMDSLAFQGVGQLNVVHIGGSHVQAGTLSDALRHGLQDLSPGLKGSRGFFFPYSLAQTNNPWNYSIYSTSEWTGCRCAHNGHHCRWGMSGINARTEDPDARARVEAYDGDSSVYAFRVLRIFHLAGDSLFAPIADTQYHEVDTFWFDDRGFTEIHFKREYETFHMTLQSSSDAAKAFVWQGIQYVDPWPGISYHSIGVNGARTKSFLRCVDFSKQMEAIAPDLVIFGIGLNDAYMTEAQFDEKVFEQRYDTLIQRVRSVNDSAALIFVTNNDSYFRKEYVNPNAPAVSRVMYRLADKYDGAVWDLFHIMGGLGSIDQWVSRGLANEDRIHLTGKGYRLEAEWLTKAIRDAWLNHLKQLNKVDGY